MMQMTVQGQDGDEMRPLMDTPLPVLSSTSSSIKPFALGGSDSWEELFRAEGELVDDAGDVVETGAAEFVVADGTEIEQGLESLDALQQDPMASEHSQAASSV